MGIKYIKDIDNSIVKVKWKYYCDYCGRRLKSLYNTYSYKKCICGSRLGYTAKGILIK
jgi:DNA-directed RNA polymerase subunit RPC12/RpoP